MIQRLENQRPAGILANYNAGSEMKLTNESSTWFCVIGKRFLQKGIVELNIFGPVFSYDDSAMFSSRATRLD